MIHSTKVTKFSSRLVTSEQAKTFLITMIFQMKVKFKLNTYCGEYLLLLALGNQNEPQILDLNSLNIFSISQKKKKKSEDYNIKRIKIY